MVSLGLISQRASYPGDMYATTAHTEIRQTTSPTTSQHQSQGNRATLDEVTVLRYINRFRSQHGSAPLQWSSTCARRAHMKANHKAGDNTLPSDYGENLARSTHERWRDPSAACMGAIDHWQVHNPRDVNVPSFWGCRRKILQNVLFHNLYYFIILDGCHSISAKIASELRKAL